MFCMIFRVLSFPWILSLQSVPLPTRFPKLPLPPPPSPSQVTFKKKRKKKEKGGEGNSTEEGGGRRKKATVSTLDDLFPEPSPEQRAEDHASRNAPRVLASEVRNTRRLCFLLRFYVFRFFLLEFSKNRSEAFVGNGNFATSLSLSTVFHPGLTILLDLI